MAAAAADPWQTDIGLEVHVQLDTRSKLFCACANVFGAPPNTNVCPVCYGLPGALPVPNRRAVELAVLAGLALNCEIPEESVFERKNYFYPDLPKGYQITQFERPIAVSGYLDLPAEGGQTGESPARRVRINRVQLEEDAGKLVHAGFPGAGDRSGVDFNRAGVPLIEVVSETDLRTAADAGAYARLLKSRMVFAGISDADMEKGNLRVDGNISVRERGSAVLGARVELKNLNSFRYLERALRFEEKRHRTLLERGEPVAVETRLFDESKGQTEAMRTKEEAEDYRYFPDPDLPPVRLPDGLVEQQRRRLPEFPEDRAARYREEHRIAADQAERIAARRDLADYYEQTLTAALAKGSPTEAAARTAARWVTGEVLAREKQDGRFAVEPARLGGLVHLRASGTLPRSAARKVFAAMCESDRGAEALVEELGLADRAAGSELETLAARLVAENPKDRDAWRAGNKKAIGAFMGRAMRSLGGRAAAVEVRAALERALAGEDDGAGGGETGDGASNEVRSAGSRSGAGGSGDGGRSE